MGGEFVEDVSEVALHGGGVEAAEAVIAAEFDECCVRFGAGEDPVEAGGGVRGCVAGDGAVDQGDAAALGVEGGGELGLETV